MIQLSTNYQANTLRQHEPLLCYRHAVWRRKMRGDLSLPADCFYIVNPPPTRPPPPPTPSQQPGQFTSCQTDWFYVDHCPRAAAKCNLIKDHFCRETLCNQADATSSGWKQHVAPKPANNSYARCDCSVFKELNQPKRPTVDCVERSFWSAHPT